MRELVARIVPIIATEDSAVSGTPHDFAVAPYYIIILANPCPVQNEYTNCDTELFPNGCDNAPDYLQDFLVYCKATCQCKGQLLY